MTGSVLLATLIVLLGATGSYLLLPHRMGTARPRRVHAAGAILASLALLGFVSLWSPPGPFLSGLFFYLFAIAAVASALLTVTSRNPVYSALWFASVVLATAGLFVLAGAQFLAAGTVIVYAGAIIVTFLFVIMLAQMEGKAEYDRAARAPGWSTFTSFLLFWCLVYSLLALTTDHKSLEKGATGAYAERALVRAHDFVPFYKLADRNASATALRGALRPTSELKDAQGNEKPNVAGLGEALYSDHLLTVELTGSLLFVALIAAVAITNPKRPIRPGDNAVPGNGR